jgi:hypothetical protein
MSVLFMFLLYNIEIIALSYTFIVDWCITVNLSDKYKDLPQGLPSFLVI